MDMSGNVYERPITVGNSTGRSFTGTHGDGVLDGNGNANVSNWPTAGAAGTIGAGFRGGYFFTGNPATDEFLRVSSRANASAVRTNDHRGYADAGGRGIRTAPTCINPTNGGTIAANQTGYSPFSPTTFDPDAFTSSALPSGQTGNLEYKWMVSTTSSSSGFSDISNSNAATYDPGTISVNTWYKRVARVNCMDDWTGAAESNVVTATVSAAPATSTFSGTGNWNQASYWNNGIPAYTTQAFISGNCTITTPSTCSNLLPTPTTPS